MGAINIPEGCKIVQAIAPVALGAAKTGDNICLKDVNKAWVVCHLAMGADTTDVTLSLYKGTADGTGGTAITTVVPIWSNLDTATNDTLTARTAAVSYAVTVSSKNTLVIFEVDPATLGDTYDWLYVYSSAGHANHVLCAEYVLDMAYKSATPPTVVA